MMAAYSGRMLSCSLNSGTISDTSGADASLHVDCIVASSRRVVTFALRIDRFQDVLTTAWRNEDAHRAWAHCAGGAASTALHPRPAGQGGAAPRRHPSHVGYNEWGLARDLQRTGQP